MTVFSQRGVGVENGHFRAPEGDADQFPDGHGEVAHIAGAFAEPRTDDTALFTDGAYDRLGTERDGLLGEQNVPHFGEGGGHPEEFFGEAFAVAVDDGLQVT